jgi:hypothetical protein
MTDGTYWVYGECYSCRVLFGFNPWRVPSIPVEGGIVEPICQACVDLANPRRIRNGLDPIVPHPFAYAPVDESEWTCE